MRWFAWLAGGLCVCGVVLIAIAPTLATHFIRAHLMSDEFRKEAEAKISTATGGLAHLDPLRWNDDGTVNAREITLENARGWDLESSGVHATLDFGAIKRRVWSITDAGADEVTLRHAQAQPSPSSSRREEPEVEQDTVANIPSFLRSYLPNSTEVAGAEVQSFNLERGAWKMEGTRMQLGAWREGQASMSVKLGGGSLHTPWQPGHLRQPIQLDIAHATLRAGRAQLLLSDASLRWRGSAEVTLRGGMNFDSEEWKLVVHAQDVPLEEFLDAWWQQRLSGKLTGDGEITGDKVGVTTWTANLALVGGVLQGLPILEKLATYTRVRRFARVVLDTCQAKLRPEGDALRVEQIEVQSNGLLRIEGSMLLRGHAIDGHFMVGVTPETLRWIPGAESHVFTERNVNGPPGLLWTLVSVKGPLDAPQEDLSMRLIGGAGMSLLFDTPGKAIKEGADTLLKPVLGGEAAKLPGKVMEGAGGLLENGVKAGTGLLEKVLPRPFGK